MLAVGYTFFGVSLALCNLITPQQAGRVCTAISPVPVICLLLQSLTCNPRRPAGLMASTGLALSAGFLPAVCAYWSHSIAIPFVLVLSASTFSCVRRRDALHWICMSGVWLSLLLALPLPVQVLEPRWGMTVSIFFLCVLCFLAGLWGGRVGFSIKSV